MLGQFSGEAPDVIADMEAGVGTLTRVAEGALDLILVVAEATPKSLETAQRAVAIAAERRIAPVRIVANRVHDEADVARVREALGPEAAIVPEDAAILDADRDGRAPLDTAPSSPAIEALRRLARELPVSV